MSELHCFHTFACAFVRRIRGHIVHYIFWRELLVPALRLTPLMPLPHFCRTCYSRFISPARWKELTVKLSVFTSFCFALQIAPGNWTARLSEGSKKESSFLCRTSKLMIVHIQTFHYWENREHVHTHTHVY